MIVLLIFILFEIVSVEFKFKCFWFKLYLKFCKVNIVLLFRGINDIYG